VNWSAPCVCGDRKGEHRVRKELPDGQYRLLTRLGPCLHIAPLPIGDIINIGDLVVRRCPCRKFQSPVRRSKREIRKRGHAFEREVLAALEGVHLGGVGQPDGVVYAPDATEMLSVETEESGRVKLPAWMLIKLEQAERLSRNRAGHPDYVFIFKLKAGRGKRTEPYALQPLDGYANLVRRARGT